MFFGELFEKIQVRGEFVEFGNKCEKDQLLIRMIRSRSINTINAFSFLEQVHLSNVVYKKIIKAIRSLS